MAPLSPLALLLASGLAYHGHRKKSLSPSGSVTAFVVGYLMLSSTIWAFGVSLIAFYLIGSRATKCKWDVVRRLESAYHEYGYRTGWQVISNSFSALVACVLWNAIYAPDSLPGWVFGSLLSFPPTLSRPLLLLALGHFACCLGDTLASELGILAKGKPRLFLSRISFLTPVPPGTNGALSFPGTSASLAGGAIMGLVMGAVLILENAVCRRDALGVVVELITIGGLCGFGGSLLDSVLGATLQETHYDADRKVVISDGEGQAEVSGRTVNSLGRRG
ncbi:uncharacterized protein SCHCODRAFT_02547695 [Schizophyllum commune H4-8]|uniref:Transmembrane protein 19 n=1 Tax=Schizophyllum commune (strain H4-8 / FGSC 9210) TaxID=578458 RepID=D8Q8V9_SCHCM|nr:uncharacterized protein SCHCODRAFT_02547695 [Schizophyllum commune H4-8]KAI5890654.1 hypothetical protein SCHCODRAFT_02547695 [Schizophyllum commune H4-8]